MNELTVFTARLSMSTLSLMPLKALDLLSIEERRQGRPSLWETMAEPHPLVLKCARMAVKQWPREKAADLVAIGIAESWLVDDAQGDNVHNRAIFNPIQQQKYFKFADRDGDLSHGWWQDFLGENWDKVQAASGIPVSTPNDAQAVWLHTPENNLRVAALIETAQGLRAWSTYNNGAYLNFLPHARLAVDVALAEPVPEPQPPIDEPHVIEIRGVAQIEYLLSNNRVGSLEVNIPAAPVTPPPARRGEVNDIEQQ